ncbi:MAG: type II toxin-antitoxin system prevent-host-death family antitoxin [Chloroflexi bacterium]|nr:type II toxin-antitoxin system prevent-host-death family antitoxin [Chloroflexota bacterium]
MVERSVGIRELKNRLSKYLRAVKAGQTILITDRGKGLIPAGQTVEEKLSALQQAGVFEWSGKLPPPRRPVAKVRGEKTVAEMLIEDRR